MIFISRFNRKYRNITDYDFMNKCDQMIMDNKISYPLDFNCVSRDGVFKKEQLFAIYEKEDIEALIDCLLETLETRYRGIK